LIEERQATVNRTVILDKQLKSEDDIQCFVNECECSLEQQMDDAASSFLSSEGNHYVALSGPTCAGKTTTARKLIEDFDASHRTIRRISIDDFFIDRKTLEQQAKEEGREPDFESVKAIDLEYLQRCVDDIQNEKTVQLPLYSFLEGKRTEYIPFEPKADDIVIFEGIQAIYPEFIALFPKGTLKSIHITVNSDLVYNGVHFDRREIRLMRRLVRDYRFRGADAALTFYMWKGVVENEDKNILPYEKNADIRIDSLMPYEIHLLRDPLTAVLNQLPRDSVYYPQAVKMMEKIAPFIPIGEEYLPENSLYHEFLG